MADNVISRTLHAAGNMAEGGFRTRVAAGTTDKVKALYHKAGTVFPEVSTDGTGSSFSDLETCFMSSDLKRKVFTDADSALVQSWTEAKGTMEAKVVENNQKLLNRNPKSVSG